MEVLALTEAPEIDRNVVVVVGGGSSVEWTLEEEMREGSGRT